MSKPRRFKLSFQARVFLPVAALLVLLPAVTLFFVQRNSFEHMLRDARSQLLTVDAVFQNSLDLRSRQAMARYHSMSTDPRFRAVSQLDDATMRNHLHTECLERIDEEAQVMLFAYADGRTVAAARPGAASLSAEFMAAAREAVTMALKGEPSSRLLEIGGGIYNVTVSPVQVNNRITGALAAGSRVGRNALKELASLVNGEAVFVARGRIADSTLAHQNFNIGLLPYWSEDNRRSPIRPMVIDNVHYLALAAPFPLAQAGKEIGYVLLHSYETAYQQLREAQAALWLICLGGVVASTAVVWLVIGRITAPLRELRQLAEAVGAGDFSRRVEIRSDDELGDLGRAFNDMTTKLRGSRADLEQTVATLRATRAQMIHNELRPITRERKAAAQREVAAD